MRGTEMPWWFCKFLSKAWMLPLAVFAIHVLVTYPTNTPGTIGGYASVASYWIFTAIKGAFAVALAYGLGRFHNHIEMQGSCRCDYR